MFTGYTYQDWERTQESEKMEVLRKIVESYKGSEEFKYALLASDYFRGENPVVMEKVILQKGAYKYQDESGVEKTLLREAPVVGARIPSNFFSRFVIQQNQFLLANGVTLEKDADKKALGLGFDKAMEQIGERALVQGVCWGYWNVDHLEIIEAARDKMSGFVALVDEENSMPRLGVQFWQIDSNRPMYIRLFEADGITVYRVQDHVMVEHAPKRAYKLRVNRDAAGETVTGAENYSFLPVIPLYANAERRSELTRSIKEKIDAYDRISSDYVDNLDKTNDVFWVLSNFGGSRSELLKMVSDIRSTGIIANSSDGMGGNASAAPYAFEVPYEARKTALELLQKELYQDYMALSMEELTGGSLTNVAIQTAMANLELKCDRYEWQCFQFVQRVLALLAINTEVIRFKRQTITNESEIIADIYTMRADIDRRTALKLNPYISADEVENILLMLDKEELEGNEPPEDVTGNEA